MKKGKVNLIDPPKFHDLYTISQYDAEKIIDKRIHNNVVEYLVKWQGFDSTQNTWEPLKHLENVQDLIEEFQMKVRKTKRINKNKTKNGQKIKVRGKKNKGNRGASSQNNGKNFKNKKKAAQDTRIVHQNINSESNMTEINQFLEKNFQQIKSKKKGGSINNPISISSTSQQQSQSHIAFLSSYLVSKDAILNPFEYIQAIEISSKQKIDNPPLNSEEQKQHALSKSKPIHEIQLFQQNYTLEKQAFGQNNFEAEKHIYQNELNNQNSINNQMIEQVVPQQIEQSFDSSAAQPIQEQQIQESIQQNDVEFQLALIRNQCSKQGIVMQNRMMTEENLTSVNHYVPLKISQETQTEAVKYVKILLDDDPFHKTEVTSRDHELSSPQPDYYAPPGEFNVNKYVQSCESQLKKKVKVISVQGVLVNLQIQDETLNTSTNNLVRLDSLKECSEEILEYVLKSILKLR